MMCLMVTVCLGTDYGINHAHHEEPWQRYQMYRKMFTNCTYVDGNLEILFLEGDYLYDMSFLQVYTANSSFFVVTKAAINYFDKLLYNVVIFLGRLLLVDLIKWVKSNVRPYVRPSTKSFFDFNEIRYVGRVGSK